METWFVNHVLGLSLSVLLLGLPRPLGAGTPSHNSTDPVTAGFYQPEATDELGNTGNGATSISYSSESLSPSQRRLLLAHAAEARAGTSDTKQTQVFTETSHTYQEFTNLSTEPLTSTLFTATEATSSSNSSTSFSRSSTSITSSSGSSTSIGSSSGSSTSISNISNSSTSISSISTSSSGSSTSIGSISGSSTSISSISNSSTSISSISTSSSASSTSIGSISGSSTSIGSSSGSITSISSSSTSISSSSDSSTSISSSSDSSTSISSSSTSSSSGSINISSSSSDWKVFTNTYQMPGVSLSGTLSQDSPDSSLRLGDATSSVSQTAALTDSTYTTTISRAGERTLLSVTSSSSNTSASYTEDSSSHQPSSTGAVSPSSAETEGYTQSAPSTRSVGRETTEQQLAGTFSQSAGSGGAQTLRPNATQHRLSSTSQETSESTPPLRVSEPNTDQSDVSVSSMAPFTPAAGGPANVSGTDQGSISSVGTSTESSTGAHSSSTQKHKATEVVSSQTGEDVGRGLTAAPATASTSASEINSTLTDMPMVTAIVHTTLAVTITERSQVREEDTSKAKPLTTTTTASTTLPPPTTSTMSLSSTFTEYTSGSSLAYTQPSTTVSTPAWQTSAPLPTRLVSPSQTQGPSTGMASPTKASTGQTVASTATQGISTARSLDVTTTFIHSPPTGSTEALHTTKKQPGGGATEPAVTTVPIGVQPTKVAPTNPCASNPCMNGGMCVSYKGPEYTCHCQQAWTGPTCNMDVDECEKYRCPAGSTCINTQGSFSCECPLGFDLKDGRTCTKAKTFLGTFSFTRQDSSIRSYAVHDIQGELMHLLNVSLSVLRGYSRSTLNKNLSRIREHGEVRISVVNMFSIYADVTNAEVNDSIQMSLSNRSSSVTHSRVVLSYQYSYHTESLCEVQKTQCDKERSTCTDSTGSAYCQCHQGYYKHNPDDLSCLECGDGYKLENGTCIPCMFGFGGFNCGNFYKLIAVVVSPAGGGLLLILVIALIVTCCKKDKNDINKIIFKSGDMQMSPYADFPKNNRISMEWGRETIEMQENGSTKNLLQMTDIYYSPALRNSDLERNGLYPFTGLPGSRHSCIYPAQWNPSFISDDSRRRDYF